MKHKCTYCESTSNKTRGELVDGGWVFADIRIPVRKYLQACPKHFDNLKTDIQNALSGKLAIKWS